MNKAALLIIGIIIGFVAGCILYTPNASYMPICNKYEECDRCYLVLEQEVTPEEYIGYDIGDDYEISITQ